MGWLFIKMTIFQVVRLAMMLLSYSILTYARCQRQLITQKIYLNNCVKTIQSISCVGNCEGSYAQPSDTDLTTIHRNCECCMPTDFAEVVIRCGDTARSIRKMTGCRCRPCNSITGVAETETVVGRGRRASSPYGRNLNKRRRRKFRY